jgi:hypothetical protein
VAVLETTSARGASDAGWQRDVADARAGLARRLARRGDLAAAEREAGASVEIAERLLQANPNDRQAARILGASLGILARVAEGRGDAGRAARTWSRAADALAPLASGSRDDQLLVPWAVALAALGRRDEARAVVDRLAATGHRYPVLVADLARTGVAWPEPKPGRR